MLIVEYRIPMPFSVDEYQIGQLFMIAKHSLEQSESGEGVEVIHNVPHKDSEHGDGRYTEKRIHLSSKLPYFIQSLIPKLFYVTEKSWNYYPYTETEYTCSFLPRFSISIKTRYENNNGNSENCLGLNEEDISKRTIDFIDIADDEVQVKHYKANEDPKYYKSKKTGRGPLMKSWRDVSNPIMCSYKVVSCSFEVWGLQSKVEDFAQKAIREILLLGHRQAFAWLDEWYGMTEDDVRKFEAQLQEETNEKVIGRNSEQHGEEVEIGEELFGIDAIEGTQSSSTALEKTNDSANTTSQPAVPSSGGLRSWFTWS